MSLEVKNIKKRIAVGVAVPFALLAGTLFLYFAQSGPPCVFNKLTGFYCLGCGAGRASVALLHGDIPAALGYNALFVLLLPFILYYSAKMYIKYVFARDVLPFFHLNKVHAVILLMVVVLFMVVRNIPVFPFCVLAP